MENDEGKRGRIRVSDMVRNLLEPVGKPPERAGGSLERTGGSLEPVRKPLEPARKSASIVDKACYAFQTPIPRVFHAILRDFYTSLAIRRTRILRAGSQCLTDQDESEKVLHLFILKSDHDPKGSSMRSHCAACLRVDVGCHAQVCAGMCAPRAIVRVAGTCPRRLGHGTRKLATPIFSCQIASTSFYQARVRYVHITRTTSSIITLMSLLSRKYDKQ